MGKGSDTLQALRSRPLTLEELEERRRAIENGGDVEATQEGEFVKPAVKTVQEPRPQPRPAGQAERATWD
jgi:hypothetical protein